MNRSGSREPSKERVPKVNNYFRPANKPALGAKDGQETNGAKPAASGSSVYDRLYGRSSAARSLSKERREMAAGARNQVGPTSKPYVPL